MATNVTYVPRFVWLLLLACVVHRAYTVRTWVFHDHGGVYIAEFDPWFQYRAAREMARQGISNWFRWFDRESWYPLGRPIGTTTYPGLQLTATATWHVGRAVLGDAAPSMNHVCSYIPAVGGGVSALLVGILAFQVTGKWPCAVFAAAALAHQPAHMSKSHGGNFDNEAVAIPLMILCFVAWVQAAGHGGKQPVRPRFQLLWAAVAGLSFAAMAWSWGGYTFLLNLIALHAGLTVLVATFRGEPVPPGLSLCYTVFLAAGVPLAMLMPVIGTLPIRSLEQLPALGLAAMLWTSIEGAAIVHRLFKVPTNNRGMVFFVRAFCVLAAVFGGLLALYVVLPEGYFGPLTSRVRGLLVTHKATGNPLVDSVSEHAPGTADRLSYFLSPQLYLAHQISPFILFPIARISGRITPGVFAVALSVLTIYFSARMSRLMSLAAPSAALAGGVAVGVLVDWAVMQIVNGDRAVEAEAKPEKDSSWELYQEALAPRGRRRMVGFLVIGFVSALSYPFLQHFERVRPGVQHPILVQPGLRKSGEPFINDDMLQGFRWLRKNTPEDARVMAWWDYGYHITGIGRRASLADGNTWNHEHIGLLGYMMTAPVEEAHSIAKHLADYVLVWARKDYAKAIHMARIANSVFRTKPCGLEDVACWKFMGNWSSDDRDLVGEGLRNSLVYTLSRKEFYGTERVPSLYFDLVYTSERGFVKIYKVRDVNEAAKQHVADPGHRECSAKPWEKDWLCYGTYPTPVAPELKQLLDRRRDFAQLEDFNRRRAEAAGADGAVSADSAEQKARDQEDEEYTKNYLEQLGK